MRDNAQDHGAPEGVILVGGAPLSGKTAAARVIEQRFILYQTLEANTASMRIVRRLGYAQYAGHVAVRLNAETPSNPPLQRTRVARR